MQAGGRIIGRQRRNRVAVEHPQQVLVVVGDDQLGNAVAVEVAHGHPVRVAPIAPHQVEADAAIGMVGRHRQMVIAAKHQVRPAIAIDVGDLHKMIVVAVAQVNRRPRLERAVAVARKHPEVIGAVAVVVVVGGHRRNIQVAVMIEVGNRKVRQARPARRGQKRGRSKRAVTVALENRHPLAVVHVADHQVQLAVLVEVAQTDGLRPDPRTQAEADLGFREPAVLVVEQHRHRVAAVAGVSPVIRAYQIRPAVAIDVAHRQPHRPVAHRHVAEPGEGEVTGCRVVVEQGHEAPARHRHRNVGLAVLVDVEQGDVIRLVAQPEKRQRRAKRLVAIAGENAQPVHRTEVAHHRVELAVAVKIRQLHVKRPTRRGRRPPEIRKRPVRRARRHMRR